MMMMISDDDGGDGVDVNADVDVDDVHCEHHSC